MSTASGNMFPDFMDKRPSGRMSMSTAERYHRRWGYVIGLVFCIASWAGLASGIVALLAIP